MTAQGKQPVETYRTYAVACSSCITPVGLLCLLSAILHTRCVLNVQTGLRSGNALRTVMQHDTQHAAIQKLCAKLAAAGCRLAALQLIVVVVAILLVCTASAPDNAQPGALAARDILAHALLACGSGGTSSSGS